MNRQLFFEDGYAFAPLQGEEPGTRCYRLALDSHLASILDDLVMRTGWRPTAVLAEAINRGLRWIQEDEEEAEAG